MKERDVRPVYMGTFEMFKKSQQNELLKIKAELKYLRNFVKKSSINLAIVISILLTMNIVSYFIG